MEENISQIKSLITKIMILDTMYWYKIIKFKLLTYAFKTNIIIINTKIQTDPLLELLGIRT